MKLQSFGSSLPMMLYRALDVLMPRFRAIYREFGLTEQQWRILRVLWEHDETPFRVLADITLIPPPSLVGVVDRLEKRGLVYRRKDTNDRRGVFVGMSDEGRVLKDDVSPRIDAAYREIQRSVEPEVWDQLLNGLDTLCRIDQAADEQPFAVKEAVNE